MEPAARPAPEPNAPSRLTVLAGPTAVGKGTVSASVRDRYPDLARQSHQDYRGTGCTERRRVAACLAPTPRYLRFPKVYSPSVARELSRPWIERSVPTHPLVEQLADTRALIGVQGPEEVLRVVVAAYRTAAAGRDWDPSAGTTTLDAATVEGCALLGKLIWEAGASDFEHGIQPGPVFHFDGGTIGLDLRFGDPDDDGRAVEAIAEGFAELGCTLGGAGGAPIVSGGS